MLLKKRFKESKGKTAYQAMTGLLNKKLSKVLLTESKIELQCSSETVSEKQLNILTDNIKGLYTSVFDTNGFENAQVTAGGVSTEEVEERTMESKLVRGMYFTGEILDIDGICGGYNLQWCWSSAYTAAMDIVKGK